MPSRAKATLYAKLLVSVFKLEMTFACNMFYNFHRWRKSPIHICISKILNVSSHANIHIIKEIFVYMNFWPNLRLLRVLKKFDQKFII